MGKLTNDENLIISSMGKNLKVTALFDNDNDANDFMNKNHDHAVVAVFQGVIFLANVYDKGKGQI